MIYLAVTSQKRTEGNEQVRSGSSKNLADVIMKIQPTLTLVKTRALHFSQNITIISMLLSNFY